LIVALNNGIGIGDYVLWKSLPSDVEKLQSMSLVSIVAPLNRPVTEAIRVRIKACTLKHNFSPLGSRRRGRKISFIFDGVKELESPSGNTYNPNICEGCFIHMDDHGAESGAEGVRLISTV
jgi:hypothetical protein